MIMRENELKIKNPRGQIIRVRTENGRIYAGRNPVKCSCTGSTPVTATPFRYDGQKVVCPECGKEIEVVMTYDVWKMAENRRQAEINREKLENLKLVLAGDDWECGIKYYKLSAQIEHDDWLKIKKYFSYHNRGWSNDSECEFDFGEPSGWLTRNPEEVEAILLKAGLIKPENTLAEITKRETAKKEQMKKINAEKTALIKECKTAFDNAVKLEKPVNLTGEKVFNPKNKEEYFMIESDKIWFVRYMQEYLWDCCTSNVKDTYAIAVYVNFDEELAGKIKRLNQY